MIGLSSILISTLANYSDNISLNALLSEARVQIPGFRLTYITLPYEPGVDFSFWGDVPTDNILTSQYASVVSFDARSGELVSVSDIREAGLGTKIVDSYRRLHFGDFAGLVSRALWALIGLAPLLLAITGMALWWKRRGQRQRAREKRRGHLSAGAALNSH